MPSSPSRSSAALLTKHSRKFIGRVEAKHDRLSVGQASDQGHQQAIDDQKRAAQNTMGWSKEERKQGYEGPYDQALEDTKRDPQKRMNWSAEEWEQGYPNPPQQLRPCGCRPGV
jgi:hypothetical protein